MKTAIVVLALLTTVAWGCGDGVIILLINTGTIVSSPFCNGATGGFDLQNQGGLVLLVAINSDTVILRANGQPGQCRDLSLGAHVRVTGPQQGMQINARSVTLE